MMPVPPSPDLAILRWLARRTYATASQVAAACAIGPGVARAHLVMLASMRLVASRQDLDSRAPRLVYHATAEGRRRAGISDARRGEPAP